MSTFNYKFIIQYKGSAYFGWQIQTSTAKTIQGFLQQALLRLIKSQDPADIAILGGGRTDAGVHALGQVVKVKLPLQLPVTAFTKGLNAHLPPDIKIVTAERVSEDFHPIRSAYWKEYQYRFYQGTENPFFQDLTTFYPYELDVSMMQKAAAIFVGKHDFSNFFCVGTDIKSPVRSIYKCEISSREGCFIDPSIKEFYVLKIIGSGFLKQMVRLIMGTIWNVGRGKTSLKQVEDALSDPNYGKVGEVAPPQGLYLVKIDYNSPWA